jgi:hypothetical protein
MKRFLIPFLAVAITFSCAPIAIAHLPYLERGFAEIKIEKPEISKAYYGWLQGKPAVYTISSAKPFLLYLNLLSPQIEAARMDYSAQIYKDGEPFAQVPADNSLWLVTYEPFANDYYAKGPEFEMAAPAGNYRIEVGNSGNSGNYVLAVGKTEDLSLGEFLRTLLVLPAVKQEFFGRAWWQAYNNLIGLGAFVALALFLILFYFVVSFVKKRRLKIKLDNEYKSHRNIGGADRGQSSAEKWLQDNGL